MESQDYNILQSDAMSIVDIAVIIVIIIIIIIISIIFWEGFKHRQTFLKS